MRKKHLLVSKDSILARLFVCLFLSIIYVLTDSQLLVYVMFIVSVYSFNIKELSKSESILISLLLLIQMVWTVLIFVVFVFDVSPLMLTSVRLTILKVEHKELVLFMSSQFLFIMTSLLYFPVKYKAKPPAGINSKALSLFLYIVMWVLTFFINSQGVIFDGGYSGNQAVYWSGLPALFIVFSAAWLLNQKRFDLMFFIMLNSVVLWWLLSGNRSEVLILLVYGNFLYLNSYRKISRNPKLMSFIYIFILLAVFVIFSFIGEMRVVGAGALSDFNLSGLFGGLLSDGRINVQTFGASIYSAIVSIYYVDINGIVWGESFIGQFKNTIPSFVPVPWERYEEVSNRMIIYQIIGGLGVLGESYLNFGLVGPVIFASIFSLLLKRLVRLSSCSFLSAWLFLSLVLYSPRFILYGYVYMHKLFVLFFILFFIKHIFLVKKGLLNNGAK